MDKKKSNKFDTLQVMEKRIEYLLGARLREKDRITRAVQTQDRLRQKYSVSEEWQSTSEIRRWRDKQPFISFKELQLKLKKERSNQDTRSQ
ncbi:MAG TPA: hypothetical protein VKA68_16195 [bacterium]|nr:hypothetical protein [bacterium]